MGGCDNKAKLAEICKIGQSSEEGLVSGGGSSQRVKRGKREESEKGKNSIMRFLSSHLQSFFC